ncbi:hypothetical protein ACFFMN_22250 [Planobispora siamensis]|uniref:Uncharacterized protein n=1 Tax=Planobispora siamensis TaxID=936338 RepID=A0A8J3WML7_9ACTN|nr:hypothetical protein [Planobispora siamensis]GIH94760.1 hypothetical protein Psi01_53900 [Planobispora siamensis]
MKSERNRRGGNWHSRNDEAHGRRMEIGDLARAAAAPGWSRLAVRHDRIGAHARTVVIRDGEAITAEGMDEPFRRLRELSYQAGTGTWFTCELEFAPGGRAYTGRTDSYAPPFEDVPPAAALAELTLFPRREPPGWLLAALPSAVPVELPVAYGERYDRWGSHLAEHLGDHLLRHPLPIAGELVYVPDTAMTASAFGQDREHGRHILHLADQADEVREEHLAMGCYKGACWVARHGMRNTGGGVRSITLDGAVLRLELTCEAADLLETETVFEVRLDLPPETIAELRTTVPAVLRSAAGPPELIGF